MFAYCRNAPVFSADSTGTRDQYYDVANHADAGTYVVTGAAVLAALCALKDSIHQAAERAASQLSDFYQYAKQVLTEKDESLQRDTPQVHHIVPKGDYSNRSLLVRGALQEMHTMFLDFGLDVATDPFNLVVVSAESHRYLHTDAYIISVWNMVKDSTSADELHENLFYLQISIQLADKFSWGY